MSDQTNGDEGDKTFVRITNAVIWTELQATRADLRDLSAHLQDYNETKKRVRQLELRFYGVLAGLISAIAIISVIASKGGLS